MKQKAILISLPPELIEEAKKQSKEIFGKPNISGLFAYYLMQNKKKNESTH